MIAGSARSGEPMSPRRCFIVTMAQEPRSRLETFYRRIEQRDVLQPEEIRALEERAGATVTFAAGTDIVPEGGRPTSSTLVVSGFAIRYKLMDDGSRQITAVHIPGDFVDLHGFLLKRMDHAVGALTNCAVVAFRHPHVREITEQFPHLTRLLWLSTLLDSAIHREWLVAMGRRSAAQAAAHLVCELYVRLATVGLAVPFRFELPTTQTVLADILGMSTVHVNRVLQQLRGDNLLSWTGRDVEILNWDALRQFAEFDETYLHLEHEPR